LRTRIAAVIGEHVEDQLTNYDAGRNECGCGHQGDDTYQQHLADAVIRELGLDVGATALFLKDGKKISHTRYSTDWIADE
jgi:hypothetical protein